MIVERIHKTSKNLRLLDKLLFELFSGDFKQKIRNFLKQLYDSY